MELCDDYGPHFVVKGRDVSAHARSYLSGLLGTQRRKNIGRIGEDVEESNYQGMQQLVSDSPWSDEATMEQLAREADGLLGGHRHSALYLDETSFVKKGNASVGVQRQYCGRLGKLENCQVGVFGCLGREQRVALIGYRLFLPQGWVGDEERCAKAKIPPAQRVHRTKTQLALEIVRESRQRGLRFSWVGGDEVYGANKEFTEALEDMGVFPAGCQFHRAALRNGSDARPAEDGATAQGPTRRGARGSGQDGGRMGAAALCRRESNDHDPGNDARRAAGARVGQGSLAMGWQFRAGSFTAAHCPARGRWELQV